MQLCIALCTCWLLLAHSLLYYDNCDFLRLYYSFPHHRLAACTLPSGTSCTVSSILALSHGILYCYDILRYIVTLAILVSSRRYRRIVGISQAGSPISRVDTILRSRYQVHSHVLYDIGLYATNSLAHTTILTAMLNTSGLRASAGDIFRGWRILCNWMKGIVSKLFGFR